MATSSEEEPTVLIVGDGDPLTDGIRAALHNRGVIVEESAVVGSAQAAIALAPDLVLLVGDAAVDGGTAVLGRLGASPLAAVVPVVLLADQNSVDQKVTAFRFGATAIVPRSASVDAIASRVCELAREIPERSGSTTGEIGEASLDEFAAMLTRELRNGILSVRGGERGDTAVRIVLGEGRAVANAVEGFVAKVKPLVRSAEVVQYEFEQHPSGTLHLLGAELSEFGDPTSSVAGMRILLADDDVARADAVAQELRARGAIVVVTDSQGSRLERARALDPAVLVIGENEVTGPGYELVRRMREDVRLRWAYLLVVAWDEIWSPASPGPVVASLVAKVAKLGEAEHSLRERAEAGHAFDARLEATGPARLLRALADAPAPLRITVHNRRALIKIDLTEGLVAGASCDLEDDKETKLRGSLALAALLQTASGRVRIEPVQSPANANIMAPVEAALTSALVEAVPLRPSEPARTTSDASGPLVSRPPLRRKPSTKFTPVSGATNPGMVAPPLAPPPSPSRPVAPPAPKVTMSSGAKAPPPKKPYSPPRPVSDPKIPRPAIEDVPTDLKAGEDDVHEKGPKTGPLQGAAGRRLRREPTLMGLPVPAREGAHPADVEEEIDELHTIEVSLPPERTVREFAFDHSEITKETELPTARGGERPPPPGQAGRGEKVPGKAPEKPSDKPALSRSPRAIPPGSRTLPLTAIGGPLPPMEPPRRSTGTWPLEHRASKPPEPSIPIGAIIEADRPSLGEVLFDEEPSAPASAVAATSSATPAPPMLPTAADAEAAQDVWDMSSDFAGPTAPLEIGATEVLPRKKPWIWALVGVLGLALCAGVAVGLVIVFGGDSPRTVTELGTGTGPTAQGQGAGGSTDPVAPASDGGVVARDAGARTGVDAGGARDGGAIAPTSDALARLATPIAVELPDPSRQIQRMSARAKRTQARQLRRAADRLLKRSRYRQAYDAYHRSLAYEPTSAASHAGVGLAQFRRGRLEDGTRWIQRAAQLAPDDAEMFVLYGDALGGSGDTPGARQAWERALELDPRNRAARRRLARLGPRRQR
jgi:DNA-binding response OmpR family regulator